MENKVEMTFTRNDVDNLITGIMTDKQWEVMSSMLEDSLIYYLHEEAQRFWQDIDYLVEEDSKFD
jgi:septin family protein